MAKSSIDKCCFNCQHHQSGGTTLLGKCKHHDKDITAKRSAIDGKYLVDKGCSAFEEKSII